MVLHLYERLLSMTRAGVAAVKELLTSIKRTCIRGRNVADMETEATFVATCDHIESLVENILWIMNRDSEKSA